MLLPAVPAARLELSARASSRRPGKRDVLFIVSAVLVSTMRHVAFRALRAWDSTPIARLLHGVLLFTPGCTHALGEIVRRLFAQPTAPGVLPQC